MFCRQLRDWNIANVFVIFSHLKKKNYLVSRNLPGTRLSDFCRLPRSAVNYVKINGLYFNFPQFLKKEKRRSDTFVFNLTKIIPLFPLSYTRSESQLLIVFKWTLYELCIAYCVMISTNQISYFKCNAVFWKWWKSFCCYFIVSPRACCLRSKGKNFRNNFSHIKVTIWLANIISTEHDQQ